MATPKLYLNVNIPGLYLYKEGVVSAPPYVTPQSYLRVQARAYTNGNPLYSSGAQGLMAIYGSNADSSVNKAYAKAFDKLTDKVASEFSVNLGETLGEGREALHMVANRIGQLTRAYSSLRKGDLKSMLREFGYRPKRRNRTWVRVGKGGKRHSLSSERVRISESELKRRVKMPAAVWLEYRLGWDPIVSEIYNSLEQTNDIHPLTFNEHVIVSGKHVVKSQTYPVRYHWRDGDIAEPESWDITYSVRLKCTVRVKEPLKKKFADNGIVNPALIAWNLTPGSMFVDWLLPVSKYLNGFTAFYGCEVRDVIRTDKRSSIHKIGVYYQYSPWNNTEFICTSSLFSRSYSPGVTSLRVPGLFDRTGTGVKSATRAATAVSVLINMLD